MQLRDDTQSDHLIHVVASVDLEKLSKGSFVELKRDLNPSLLLNRSFRRMHTS